MIIRSLLLLIPLALWSYVFINQHVSTKERTASFMGFVWAFHSSLILNMLFIRNDLFTLSIQDNLFYGIPFDWVFTQAVILGAVIPLGRLYGVSKIVSYILQIVMIAVVYSSAGLAIDNIYAGFIIVSTFIFCSLPAMALSNWTARDTHIRERSLLQALSWAWLLLWMFPSTVFSLTNDSWDGVLQRDLITTFIYLLPLVVPAYLLISALYQFAVEGDGTAFPYDPPKRLVIGGVYQYLSNPMQVGISLMMGWWGVVIQSLWISLSAMIAFILFIVFKDVCNGSCAIGKGNKEWEDYQQSVPKWLPKLKARSTSTK